MSVFEIRMKPVMVQLLTKSSTENLNCLEVETHLAQGWELLSSIDITINPLAVQLLKEY